MTWKLQDLCSGAGGAARGYADAGFDVTGVDVLAQPRYPFTFIQADVLTVSLDGYDAYHASPPCKDHMKRRMPRQQTQGTGYLLEAVRERLAATGKPYVIENVPRAPVRPDIVLCGCMIGRPELKRVRWFELSWPVDIELPRCHHPGPVINTLRSTGGPWARAHGKSRPSYQDVAEAIGVPWMRGGEIIDSVPPGYTNLIGQLLLSALETIHGRAA